MEGGGLEATYAVHCRLIGKLLVDFLLVIRDFFSLGYATLEYRLEVAVFEGMGSAWPKILGRRGCSPSTVLLVGKIDESFFHKV